MHAPRSSSPRSPYRLLTAALYLGVFAVFVASMVILARFKDVVDSTKGDAQLSCFFAAAAGAGGSVLLRKKKRHAPQHAPDPIDWPCPGPR